MVTVGVGLARGRGIADGEVGLAILLCRSLQPLSQRLPSRLVYITKIEQIESLGKSLLVPQVVVGFPLLYARGLSPVAGNPSGS